MSSPNQERLYPDDVYAVRPETYNPVAIDAVANFLCRTFGMHATPDPGLVRHIISDPPSGLQRFVTTNREQVDPKLASTVSKQVDSIRRVIEAALFRHHAEIEARKPKYDGVQPMQTMAFISMANPAIRTWAMGALQRLKQEKEGDDTLEVVAQIEETMTEGLGENFKEFCEQFSSFIRLGTEKNATRQELFFGMLEMINRHFLIPHGQFISPTGLDSRGHEGMIECEIEGIHLFETEVGRIPSLTIAESENEEGEIKTPCFDVIDQVVVMPVGYMLTEAKTIFVHNCTNKLAKKLSIAAGDYRFGNNERRYYRTLWEGSGTVDDLITIQAVLGSDEMHPFDQWKKIKDIPAIKNMWFAVQAEELRHGMDDSSMRTASKTLTVEERESIGIPTEILTKPESKLRTEFQNKVSDMTLEQRRMMDAAVMEFIGKTAQISGGISPKIGIAHILYTLESSRLMKEKRFHTFRDELENANRPVHERETWEHAMASRMIAVKLGNYFGYTKAEFTMDGALDDVDLVNVLQRLERLSDNQLRLAIRETTKDELVISIDAKPFPRINDDGSLDLDQ